MVFKVVAWAISVTYSVFQGLFHVYRRGVIKLLFDLSHVNLSFTTTGGPSNQEPSRVEGKLFIFTYAYECVIGLMKCFTFYHCQDVSTDITFLSLLFGSISQLQ